MAGRLWECNGSVRSPRALQAISKKWITPKGKTWPDEITEHIGHM